METFKIFPVHFDYWQVQNPIHVALDIVAYKIDYFSLVQLLKDTKNKEEKKKKTPKNRWKHPNAILVCFPKIHL